MKRKDTTARDAGMNPGSDTDQLRKLERSLNSFASQLAHLLSGDSNSTCLSACSDVYACVRARSCLCVCTHAYIDAWHIVMALQVAAVIVMVVVVIIITIITLTLSSSLSHCLLSTQPLWRRNSWKNVMSSLRHKHKTHTHAHTPWKI